MNINAFSADTIDGYVVLLIALNFLLVLSLYSDAVMRDPHSKNASVSSFKTIFERLNVNVAMTSCENFQKFQNNKHAMATTETSSGTHLTRYIVQR